MQSLRWDLRIMVGLTGLFVVLVSLLLLLVAAGYVSMVAAPLTDEYRMAQRLGNYCTGVLGCAVAPWVGAAGIRRLRMGLTGRIRPPARAT